MRIGALIYARMESERLPGKSMKDLFGRPLVGWQVQKALDSPLIDEVVLAIPDLPEDDVMAEYFEDKCSVFRGDPESYNLRMLQAARYYELTHFLPISGDSPFVDPEVMDVLCRLMRDNPTGYDTYGITVQASPTPVEGLWCGAAAISHLEAINAIFEASPAEQQDRYRECSATLAALKGYVPRECLSNFSLGDVLRTHMKLSIDYPVELMVANAVCKCIGHFPTGWRDIHWAYRTIRPEHFF